jgi:hypothetical protein
MVHARWRVTEAADDSRRHAGRNRSLLSPVGDKVQAPLVERGLIGMDGALAVGVSEPGARQAGPYDSGGLFTWGRR